MTTPTDRWRCQCGRAFTSEEVGAQVRGARFARKRGRKREPRCYSCQRPLADAKLEKAKDN